MLSLRAAASTSRQSYRPESSGARSPKGGTFARRAAPEGAGNRWQFVLELSPEQRGGLTDETHPIRAHLLHRDELAPLHRQPQLTLLDLCQKFASIERLLDVWRFLAAFQPALSVVVPFPPGDERFRKIAVGHGGRVPVNFLASEGKTAFPPARHLRLGRKGSSRQFPVHGETEENT